MTQHGDCQQEGNLEAMNTRSGLADRRINSMETKTANINGKLAVLFLVFGCLSAMGFTTVSSVHEEVTENSTSISAIVANLQAATAQDAEFRREVLTRFDRVLTVIEKVDTRVRQIEIKQGSN